MGTGGVLRYTLDMIKTTEELEAGKQGAAEDQPAREADLDAGIRDAQKRAAQQSHGPPSARRRKDEFDRRALGKR